NPLLRPVAAQAGYTVERWADERAAAQAGNRTLAAVAVARAALATSQAPPERDAAMAALGLITQEDDGRPDGEARASQAPARSPRAWAPRGRLARARSPRAWPARDRSGPTGRAQLQQAGPVPRRVAALLAPPPRLPLLLLAAAIVLIAVSGGSVLDAARDFHQLIELAQGPAR